MKHTEFKTICMQKKTHKYYFTVARNVNPASTF